MDKDLILKKAKEYVETEKDKFFRDQVETLINQKNFDELEDRFYTDLEFGTGGLRGVIGGGTNRMNPLVVRNATQGLASYVIKASYTEQPLSAVIAYDSRNFSDTFALEAALVLCANGIRTYLFTSLRPTPELSFAVRKLGASAGIVVTASHNPAEYNGYKVYWCDGAQVLPPHDKGIISEVRDVTEVRYMSKEDALASGKLVMIDREIDEQFLTMVKNCALRPQLMKEKGKDLKVVYTPLNGAGAIPVRTALNEMGINVKMVEEQSAPDGNFPGLAFPNPEEASAMKLALELAEKENADLVIGTDPDADRLGIAVRDNGELKLITGNQLGSLLADYILCTRKELGTMPEKPAIVKTIVTTELQRAIANEYGAECCNTLTGFKYIGDKIRMFRNGPDGITYVFGGEESYGYLVNTEVRDKDAVSTATMVAEMVLYYQSIGKTLFDRLRELWFKHGYYEDVLVSNYFKGPAGQKQMGDMMERFQKEPVKASDFKTMIPKTIIDYWNGTTLDLNSNCKENNVKLPKSKVIQVIFTDGSVLTIRPSGTEPKAKFYISCRSDAGVVLGKAQESVRAKISEIKEYVSNVIKNIVECA